MIIKQGCTRIVWVRKNWVLKIPNPTYSWQNFLRGLIANIGESNTWKYTQSELLCPVLWTSWGGWFLIMARADVERHESEIRALPWGAPSPYQVWIDSGYGGDDKVSNYGYFKDRLVKIDYC